MKRSRQLLRKLLLASLMSIFVFVGILPGKVSAAPLNVNATRLTRERAERLGLPQGIDLRRLPTGRAAGLADPDTCPTQEIGLELQNPQEWNTTATSSLSANRVDNLILAGVKFDKTFLYHSDIDVTPTYIPPTIHVNPGNTVNLALTNNLTNNTNFHYHGFQVSPQEGSDDVLKTVAPGEIYPMTVNVPAEHQPGLDWYHPHYHGNTAQQVGLGMAGLIIVEGMENYYPIVNGIPQKVMLFKGLEQLNVGGNTPYNCFTINGQVKPQITIQPGESQFWRMANANSSIYLNLVLVEEVNGNYIPKPLQVLGLDGYPIENTKALEKKSILLPPGSRAEVLVSNLEEGKTYKLISIGAKKTLNDDDDPYYNYLSGSLDQGKAQYTLATVTPAGTPVSNNFIDTTPRLTGNWLLPTPEDLVNNTGGFPITMQPDSPFSFTSDVNGNFMINGEIYGQPGATPINVEAGTIQDWKLVNDTDAPHTFHIHQTHFVVTKSCQTCDGTDDWTPPELTYQDNIDLPAHKTITVRIPFINTAIITGGETIGTFVFHCHVLAHEDSGMMREVHAMLNTAPAGDSEKLKYQQEVQAMDTTSSGDSEKLKYEKIIERHRERK